MSNSVQQRDPYIDVLRALAIISIVIGHGGGMIPIIDRPLSSFVYLYHLMMFFFISGLCFKKEYGTQPYLYMGKRIKSLAPTFILYSVFFTLIHNQLLALHMISSEQYLYGMDNWLEGILMAFSLWSSEPLLGAFWFISVYLVGNCVFSFLFSEAEKKKCPLLFHLIFILVTALIGIYVNARRIYINYHLQTAVLGIPVIYLGFAVRSSWQKCQKYIHWLGGLICAGILLWIVAADIGGIELARNEIMSPVLFYPVTVTGIYFCMALAKYLNRVHPTQKVFAYIGRNSYHIMALHFLAFKIVDFIYGTIYKAPYSEMEAFPHGFYSLGQIHNLAGIILPLVFIEILRFVIRPKISHQFP
ncbi:MAG: acyltransferase family protein [Enterocloster sp.]